jgi:hypothetical protein
VDGTVDGLEELPDNYGRYVTQNRIAAAGEGGGHEAPVQARCAMSYRVDALMHSIQAPTLRPLRDRVAG